MQEIQEIQKDFQDAIESRIIQGGRQLGKSMSTHKLFMDEMIDELDKRTLSKPSISKTDKAKKKKAQQKAKMSRKRNKKS